MPRSFSRPVALGVIAGVCIAIGSYGAGATRYRGGVMRALGLEPLTYGHGRALMDITLTIGILALVFAWVWVGRARVADMRRVTWAWTAPIAFSAPILSRDVYSYLMQGAMLRDGFDPYSQGAASNPGPFLWEVSHDWRNTTTPYGPLHLGLGKAVTTVVGDNVTAGVVAYKLLALIGFALIVWAVPRLAESAGGDPQLALWLGAANPVILLHLVGGMHNEAIMVGLVSVGLLASVRWRQFTLGIALIAVAVSLKATAAVALPFVVWMMVGPGRRPGRFVACGAWAAAVTGAVLQLVTWLSGSTWGWVAEITGNSKVINPLAGPTFAAEVLTPLLPWEYNQVLAASRTVFSLAMLAGLVAVWWTFRPRGGEYGEYAARGLAGTTAAYTVAFATNAVTLPWYYASILSLAGTFRPPRWVIDVTVGASIVVALAFTGGGNHRLYDLWFLALASFAAVAAVKWIRTPSPARDESLPGPSGRAARPQDAPAENHPA